MLPNEGLFVKNIAVQFGVSCYTKQQANGIFMASCFSKYIALADDVIEISMVCRRR